MSKNVNVNGVDYSGISQVQLKTADGGTALFKDVDEIVTPSGIKTITENGTYDVTNFATIVANIAASGGGLTNISMGQKKPDLPHQFYIPVEADKKPVCAMFWSDEAYAEKDVTCGGIIGMNVLRSSTRTLDDSFGIVFANASGSSALVYSNFYKGNPNGYDSTKGYLADRLASDFSYNTDNTFNYIVFYAPIGDLSFGGA